jgi:hypothetical protein
MRMLGTRTGFEIAVGGLRMNRMREDQIPDFVRELLAIGCDICAIGDEHYAIDDGDLAPEVGRPKLDRISAEYGNRDHLKLEIVAYLHSIGRSFG